MKQASQPAGAPDFAYYSGPLRMEDVLDSLAAEGYASEENVTLLKSLYSTTDQKHGHVLMEIANRGWNNERAPGKRLTADVLMDWLQQKCGLPIYHIDPLKMDVGNITKVVSYAYAARFKILAVEVTRDRVTFAVCEPFDRDWENELAAILGKEIRRVLAPPADIERYLPEFYSLSNSVLGAKDRHQAENSGIQNLEQLMELSRNQKLDANDAHVVSIVDWLFQYAFEQRASDIHLEPRREVGQVRFRIDGVLHQVYEMPASVMAAVLSRIKIVGRMDIAEKRRPQDGRLKTRNPDGKEVELRLSTMPTAFGEKLVIRIFNPETLLVTAEGLGFSGKEVALWKDMATQPYGILLVTGPTGSGKTTTLYSTLKWLAQPDVNVCTIEDPIELVDPAFNQMQVQHGINLDFASGVRTLLRQDPDIIMIGEIRDYETAEMAIQAALTGHLVLSTLHTNDAPSAVTRLIELGVPPYLINSTLIGVMAQRLLRTLCSQCKTPHQVTAQSWEQFVIPWKVPMPRHLASTGGCLICRNTGYHGRTAIAEIMRISESIKQLIVPQADAALIKKRAIAEGMVPLRMSGARKVIQGLTTMEEVARTTPGK